MLFRSQVSFVAIDLVDAESQIVPDLARPIQLSITGPAELIAFGSGSPFATGSFQATVAQTWNGRALAILRSQGRPGTVGVTVSGEGLTPGTAILRLT